jgi:methionyl-tRNA formyltransferase
MGTPDFGVPVLESLSRSRHDVVAVYTRPDRPAGRGKRSLPSLVKQAAIAAGIPVLEPLSLKGDESVHDLRALRPDLVVVAAFAYLLPREMLSVPPRGCLNVHPSLLPRYRGPSPVATALLNGDSETGVSIMLMDDGLDTGPVLSQERVPIDDGQTTGSLTMALAAHGARLLLSTIDSWMEGRVSPWPQPENEATHSVKITSHDGAVDWSLPAGHLARQVRAYHPWPGSYTKWKGARLKIHRAEAVPMSPEAPSGTVVERQPGVVGVATGEGLLALERVQLEGRREMSVDEFVRGHRDFMGSLLVS